MHFTESNTDASATVLLVEDDRPLLEFFSTVLRRDGHTVLEAENGAEALELSEGHTGGPIDILLTDVVLPYMDGAQLAERIMEVRPEIRVILTSGLPMEIVMERCGPGFKGEFLPKPFSVFDLSGRIKRLSEAA